MLLELLSLALSQDDLTFLKKIKRKTKEITE